MTETADWKQKYRDSLLEIESEEKRWRQVELTLRRLVGRLCAAGMGVNPALDDELVALAAANRRNAEASELEALAQSLTTAVVAVDAVAPVPNVPGAARPAASPPSDISWEGTRGAANKLLTSLQALGIDEAAVIELASALQRVRSDRELAGVLDAIADLVRARAETLARERLEAAAVLAEVTKRLGEMAGYLEETGNDADARHADTVSINDDVMSQVRELAAEATGAADLQALQKLVNTRLEIVSRQVMEFRSREDRRQQEHKGRAERMRSRIEDLERETLDLHSKLDQEKHVARVDPLTRLANRKSFDERISVLLEKRERSGLEVCLLLWDIDNFKHINDSYGHRAGDRVLQNVAACLLSGLRAEDFVARIGGEEFVVLLAGVPFARAAAIADELRCGVAALRFHFRGTPVQITVSCGLTELRPNDTVGRAFDRADAALYRAKDGGRNLCVAA